MRDQGGRTSLRPWGAHRPWVWIHWLVLALVTLVPSPANAFTGHEHRCLSNQALDLALEVASEWLDEDLASRLRNEWLPPRKGDRLTLEEACREGAFGDFVVSVDHFKSPVGIEVALTRCEKGDACGEQLPTGWCLGEDNPNHEELEDLGNGRAAAWKAVRRSYRWRGHLGALFSNSTHFQAPAAANHLANHACATRLAGETSSRNDAEALPKALSLALIHEAYGLHYLQDFLAAGHQRTPRSGEMSYMALSIHDRYNDIGVLALVGDGTSGEGGRPDVWTERLEQALDARRSTANGEGSCSGSRVTGNQPCEVTLFGDGRLRRSTRQEDLAIVLSARSLLEVLNELGPSRPPPSQWMTARFWPRTGKSYDEVVQAITARSGLVDPKEIERAAADECARTPHRGSMFCEQSVQPARAGICFHGSRPSSPWSVVRHECDRDYVVLDAPPSADAVTAAGVEPAADDDIGLTELPGVAVEYRLLDDRREATAIEWVFAAAGTSPHAIFDVEKVTTGTWDPQTQAIHDPIMIASLGYERGLFDDQRSETLYIDYLNSASAFASTRERYDLIKVRVKVGVEYLQGFESSTTRFYRSLGVLIGSSMIGVVADYDFRHRLVAKGAAINDEGWSFGVRVAVPWSTIRRLADRGGNAGN